MISPTHEPASVSRIFPAVAHQMVAVGMVPLQQDRTLDLESAVQLLDHTRSAVDEAVAEFVCPITQCLPVDPVTAEVLPQGLKPQFLHAL